MLRQVAISCLIFSLPIPALARTRPHYGGTLRVEIAGDAWPMTGQQHGGLARRLALDGLTRIDADGAARPALAVRWESENNDHRWQFWLRPGVHFSDGSALTSTAVVDALSGSCGAGCPWTEVHAVGSTVIFTGDSPLPNLPVLLAGDDLLIARAGSIASGASSIIGPFIGTGAFLAVSLSNGILSLTANDSCWQGRPFVDKIEIAGHKSIREQWLDMSVGRADLV